MTDEQLMLEVSKGDLDKVSVLFERYQIKLYNFFYRLTYDKDLSQDMTQNLFVRVIKYRKSYKEGSKFRSWVYQIARNVNADHFRSQKVYFSDFTEMDAVVDNLEDSTDSKLKEVQEKNLAKAMSYLSDEQREILVMNRYQDLTYEDIAKIMNSTSGAIKVKAHRAIKKLRTFYFKVDSI